ncbi:hypothetical protein [Undibacterium flavidum]|uniref:Virion structural protein n=1 Tax=Undibacterium flavidum TaxID=2762297 RepID=A0ABR6YAK1_9BURK|nr:hypothetical protein [Undibacterium flavidum]MBC3873635.1 hypothetical protein [Undibacterium flavidum]
MNWNDILNLRVWTPLSAIGDYGDPIIDGIFEIETNTYVKTQTHNRNFELGDPNAPFITKVFWATNLDALKRHLFGDPALGKDAPKNVPPSNLLNGTTGKYVDILNQTRQEGKVAIERAVYSNSGEFLYKAISIGRVNYCFLNPQEDEQEQVFLVDLALVR